MELLKAGGEAMTRGLHAVLTAIWQSGTIPLVAADGLIGADGGMEELGIKKK